MRFLAFVVCALLPFTALAAQEYQCPATLAEIQSSDVGHLAQCPEKLQKDLCKSVCGARYSDVETRSFPQVRGDMGLACYDYSNKKRKGKLKIADDENRQLCQAMPFTPGVEIQNGLQTWCVTYNKSLHGVRLRGYVQCVGAYGE